MFKFFTYSIIIMLFLTIFLFIAALFLRVILFFGKYMSQLLKTLRNRKGKEASENETDRKVTDI